MKTMQRLKPLLNISALLTLTAALLVTIGCGSSGETVDADDTAQAEAAEPVYQPKEGMTKQEIIEMYEGEPDQKSINSDGSETWRYHTNAGEAWIPYNFGYQPEFHVINFDTEGRVQSYSLNE